MRVRESAVLFGASLYAGTTMVALMSAAALPADLREDMPSPLSPMAAPKQATRARADSRTLNRVVDTPRSLACSPASNGVHPGGVCFPADPRFFWRPYTEKRNNARRDGFERGSGNSTKCWNEQNDQFNFTSGEHRERGEKMVPCRIRHMACNNWRGLCFCGIW